MCCVFVLIKPDSAIKYCAERKKTLPSHKLNFKDDSIDYAGKVFFVGDKIKYRFLIKEQNEKNVL